MKWRGDDIRTILGWLTPDYILPSAKEHGISIAASLICHPYDKKASYEGVVSLLDRVVDNHKWLYVLGAEGAYKESRSLIRNYLRFIKKRDNISINDLNLALLLRQAGYVGNFQPVTPITNLTSWRELTFKIWENGVGSWTPGDIQIEIGNANQKAVDLAVIKAASEALLLFPEVNRAILQNSLWQRTNSHVMIHMEPAPEQIRSIIIDPAQMSLKQLKNKLFKSLKALIKAEKSEFKPLTDQLFSAWCETGFIASPAGVMISCVGSKGIYKGKPALLTHINGIPSALVIGKVDNHKVWVTAEFDHRANDAHHCSRYYNYLINRVPEILGEEGLL